MSPSDAGPAAPWPGPDPWERRTGALVVLVSAAYMLLWWNRYLGPTSGGEGFYLAEFAAGRIPYRDFYYFAPPGTFLTSLAVGLLAGSHQIAFHLFGLVFRVFALWVLHRWLREQFRPGVAAFATVVTGIVAAGDISDYPNFFQHQAVGFSLFGGFAASRSLRSTGARRLGWAAFSGLLLGVNLLYKQTTGLLVLAAVTVFLVVGTWAFASPREAVRSGLAEIAGLSLPVGAVLAWLAANAALPSFFDQVFVSGPASKGGLARSLVRPVAATIGSPQLAFCAFLAIALLAGGVFLARPRPGSRGPGVPVIPAMTLVVLLLVIAGALGRRIALTDRTLQLAAVYVGMLGGPVVAALAVARGRRGELAAEAVRDRVLLAAVGTVTALSMSISYPAFEPMAYPGLAIVLASFLDEAQSARAGAAGRNAIVALALVTVFVASWRKHVSPYDWGLWSEPSLDAPRAAPGTRGLEGFVLSESTARLFDDVTAAIRAFSREDDRLLVYPHMPIFFALSERRPAGFVFSYWLDICPDARAIADAREIQAHPPAVMLVADLPVAAYVRLESMFRSGRPSGQRVLAAAIERLAAGYRCVYRTEAAGTGLPVRVLVRNDRAAAPLLPPETASGAGRSVDQAPRR